MSSLDERPFPTGALIGAGMLILTTIVGVGSIQLSKHYAPPPAAQAEAPVQSRQLRFVDEGDGMAIYGGHVKVFDVATGIEYPELRDRDGFIRAVLNSLTFERTKSGVVSDPVFELASWADNRVTLKDLSTGKQISLGAFGNGNKVVFLRFFQDPVAKP